MLRQDIQQAPLHTDARQLVQTALAHGGQHLPQVFQRVEADLLAQGIVDRGGNRLAQLLRGNVERRDFPGQFLGLVVFGERHLKRLRVAGPQAIELFDEAGNEVAAADIDIGIGRGATLERDAIDLTQVIDGEDVALGGTRVFAARGQLFLGEVHEVAVAFGEIGQRLIDFLRRHLGDLARQRERRKIGHRDVGQDFHLDLEFKVGRRTRRGGIGGDDFQLRRDGGAQRALRHQLLGGFIDELFQNFGRDGAAISLLHDRHRHLAGPEAGQVDLLREFRKPRRAPAFYVGRRHNHGVRALEAIGKSLGHLHLPIRPIYLCTPRTCPQRPRWCGRRDLNPHGLRHQNLNLACLPIPPRPRHPATRAAFGARRIGTRERGALAQPPAGDKRPLTRSGHGCILWAGILSKLADSLTSVWRNPVEP